jgi:glutamate-ammonia-ligase adenylyltransferase
MADHVGGLSVIAGLLTAHQIDVTGAGVFTLTLDVSDGAPAPAASGRRTRRRRRPQRAPVPARLMLGIFELRTLEPAAPDWDAFERDLQAAVSMMAGSGLDTVRALVMDRVSETVRLDEQRETRLLPVSIDVDQEASPDATVMRISSSDTPGFLFEFTNALALLDANIARAEIRTGEEVAQDTFWLTDARAAQGHGRGAA